MNKQFSPLPLRPTLEEAAAAISTYLGQEWTARTILGCASRGEISIYARLPTGCRMVRCIPLEGEPNELAVPAGSMPRISARAATALQCSPVISFDELTFPRTNRDFGPPFQEMATEWTLADGESAPEITLNLCRVTDVGVFELAKRYGWQQADQQAQEPINDKPPGSYNPRTAVGKLALKAAWEIERKQKHAATAKETMALLQQWAKEGLHSETLMSADEKNRGVNWLTMRGGEKLYDEETLSKTLSSWRNSRHLGGN